MRATISDVAKHPKWLGDWWLELPSRHAHWWKWLLLEPGSGWLRWKLGEEEYQRGWYDPPEYGTVAPPVRLAAIVLHSWVAHPYNVLRGRWDWREWVTLSEWNMMRADGRWRAPR